MLLNLHHETHYRYSPAVENAHHIVHLQPASDLAQTVLSHQLHISPPPDHQRDTKDVFGNYQTFFSVHRSHLELSVSASSVVNTHRAQSHHNCGNAPWESTRERYVYRAGSPHDAAWQFVFASPFAPDSSEFPEFAEFAAPSFLPSRPLAEAAHDLMSRVHSTMSYDGDATDVNTPPLLALRQGKGVCQDFAHIMVACCRALGLPARYVSGYMLTQPLAGQNRLIGCDATHAWVQVYCADPQDPERGEWLDFDPTNNRVPLDEYIVLATGRDYLDVSPVRGVIHGGAQHTLSVAVTVTPVDSVFANA